MCHYITAVLPGSADLAALRPIFGAYRKGMERVTNAVVQEQLRDGDVYLCLTRGMCDCGTVLGCLAQSSGAMEVDPRELRRLQRKGWSETRIARWVEERERDFAKKRREQEEQRVARAGEAEAWIAFLEEVLASGHTSRIGLLLHWYRGDTDTEAIRIQKRDEAPLERTTAEFLMAIEEDVLYEFSHERSPGRSSP